MATSTIGRRDNSNAIRNAKIQCEKTKPKTIAADYMMVRNSEKIEEKLKSRTNRKPVDIKQLFDDWDGKCYVAEEIDWGSPQGNEMW